MAELSKSTGSANDDTLTTISAKIPRHVQDTFIRVCADTDLTESSAICIALTKLAEFLDQHWRRGPALGPFLEHLKFDVAEYNKTFQRKG